MPRRKENYEIAQDKDNFYYARSGAVIVRKRERSKVWQCTFKIDNQWVRRSTNERDLDKAIDSACESYDRLRFLQEADITVVSKRFKSVANATLKKLQAQIDSGLGKVIYKDYVAVINNYLIPFFGMYQVHTIDITALQQFNSWRKEKLGRMPAKSTIATHNSALNAVMEMGIERGLIKTNPMDMQFGKSFINCTEDTALPQSLSWHPRLSEKLGLFRLIQLTGSHELCFTDPASLAASIMKAGRD